MDAVSRSAGQDGRGAIATTSDRRGVGEAANHGYAAANGTWSARHENSATEAACLSGASRRLAAPCTLSRQQRARRPHGDGHALRRRPYALGELNRGLPSHLAASGRK
jgi:hypothetical protein